MTFSALIVDDERPARRRLIDLLSKDDEIGACWEADNGAQAVRMIQEVKPDILFLDVQMPGVDGFGVVHAIGVENMPLTVFVTAYDRFAVQAFEAHAVDYLLKPFGDRRYEATIQRLKSMLREPAAQPGDETRSFGRGVLELMAKRSEPGAIWRWIVLKDRDQTRLLMADDIEFIEAAGIYVTIHSNDGESLYRSGLTTLEARLDPFQFVRIHRSAIVNIRSVALLERRSHGEFDVVMSSGSRLVMSRTYRGHFEKMLGQPL